MMLHIAMIHVRSERKQERKRLKMFDEAVGQDLIFRGE